MGPWEKHGYPTALVHGDPMLVKVMTSPVFKRALQKALQPSHFCDGTHTSVFCTACLRMQTTQIQCKETNKLLEPHSCFVTLITDNSDSIKK